MNYFALIALLVPKLFVVKTQRTLGPDCTTIGLGQIHAKDSCTDLEELKQFLKEKWKNKRFIREIHPDNPFTRPTKPSKIPDKPTTKPTVSTKIPDKPSKKANLPTKKPDETKDRSNSSKPNKEDNEKNSTIRSKIIGANRELQEFDLPVPYLVGIHFKKDENSMPVCAGVLIKPDWILTSEICITRNLFQQFSTAGFIRMPLVVANTDQRSRMGKKPVSTIKTICKLTDYHQELEETHWGDVILARIEPKLYINLRYPRLPPWRRFPEVPRALVVAGYGSVNLNPEMDVSQGDVRRHWIYVVEMKRCEALLTKRANKYNMFCATGHGSIFDGNAKARGHSCLTDAGAAIYDYYTKRQWPYNDKYPDQINGIMSNLDYEKPCMTNHHWRLYSRVDIFIDAVRNVLKTYGHEKFGG